MVYHMKNVLENHGIACQIRGEYRKVGTGFLPPTECWPELWIIDDSQFEEADKIIEEALETEDTEEKKLKPWRCPGCGEEVEGQFDECWNCGTAFPDNK